MKYTFRIGIGNLLDDVRIFKDKIVSYPDGALKEAVGQSVTDFITVEKGQPMKISGIPDGGMVFVSYWGYDSAGKMAGSWMRDSDGMLDLPDRVESVRLGAETKLLGSLWFGVEQAVTPNYDDKLSISIEKESGEEFFRRKLGGKLTFFGHDYLLLDRQPFETEYLVHLDMDGKPYWRGKFVKTDCEWDADEMRCVVQPQPDDGYNEILDGIDKEVDIIKLAPEIARATLNKRPMVQMYLLGGDTITNIVGGSAWDNDVTETITEKDQFHTEPYGMYEDVFGVISLDSPDYPDAGGLYFGVLEMTGGEPAYAYQGTLKSRTTRYTMNIGALSKPGNPFPVYSNVIEVFSPSGKKVLHYDSGMTIGEAPEQVVLESVETGAAVTIASIRPLVRLFSRMLTASPETVNTDGSITESKSVPNDDFGYSGHLLPFFSPLKIDPSYIVFSDEASEEPTEYGQGGENGYFVSPGKEYIPVCMESWGLESVWIKYYDALRVLEQRNRTPFTLRHAYPLSSVISVMLNKIAPKVSHKPTEEYSRFLYSESNPVSGSAFSLLVSPKTNVTKAYYSQEAKKGIIKLSEVTEMLRSCFQCYWFVEDGKFRIEHISFFQRGGSYDGERMVGVSLPSMENPRNGKTWAFNTSAWKFDKYSMPERYEFGWMDDVSEAFAGEPVEMLSRFVDKGQTEDVTVSAFTTDVDYMMLNAEDIEQDGFALLAAAGFKPLLYNRHYDVRIDPATGKRVAAPGFFVTSNDSETDKGFDVAPFGHYLLGHAYPGAWYDSAGKFIYGFVPAKEGEPEKIIAPERARYYIATFKTGESGNTFVPQQYEVPINAVYGYDKPVTVQNNILAFPTLQELYYERSFPSRKIRMNGVEKTLPFITPNKTQEVSVPALADPNPYSLVRTGIGDGEVSKISITLLSRMAKITLAYETDK